MRTSRNDRNSSSGFSMIEILIAIGVLGIVANIVVSLLTLQTNGIVRGRLVMTRDNMRYNLDRYLSDSRYLGNSLAYSGANNLGNLALKYCIDGPPASPDAVCSSSDYPNCCRQSAANESQPFLFIDPTDPEIVIGGTVAGGLAPAITVAQPAAVSIEGMPCALGNSACAIEVETGFKAQCAGGVNRCRRAMLVSLQYSLKKSESADGAAFPNMSLKTIKRSFAVSSKASSFALANLRFTRARVAPSVADSGKDLVCEAEFGADYMAANANEVVLNGKGGKCLGGGGGYLGVTGLNCPPFTTSSPFAAGNWDTTPTPRRTYALGSLFFIFDSEPAEAEVACIHKSAPFRFTRQLIDPETSDAEKDALCKSEFGFDMIAASANEVATYAGGFQCGSSFFSTSGCPPFTIAGTLADGVTKKLYNIGIQFQQFNFLTATAGQVACISH